MDEITGIPIADVPLQGRLMNAAGMLGFAPSLKGPVSPGELGAFVTNPISLTARTPAAGTRLVSYPGGLLLHTGLPNPGLDEILRQYSRRWARQRVPVIVHLVGEEPYTIARLAARLENKPGVSAFELGLPPGVEAGRAVELIQAAVGETPLVVRLSLDQVQALAEAVLGAGASALSLGPPRGALPIPGGGLVSGRLYGPGLFPQALEAVRFLSRFSTMVIGGCGVFHPSQVDAMLQAGAAAVQLDLVLWRGPWPTF